MAILPKDQPKPSGQPAPTEESKERYRLAQLAQQEKWREQAELMERHRAEANYGMATSARAPVVIRPPPVPPAKKSSPPASASSVYDLYRAASASQKAMAYEAMAKVLAPGAAATVPKGAFAMAPTPVKAMPSAPPAPGL